MKITYFDRELITVTSAEISRNFGRWQDQALQGPIVVTNHGRPRIVILSTDEYGSLAAREQPIASESVESATLAYRTVLNHVAQAYVGFDADLTITSINAAFENLVGRPASAMLGRSWEAAFEPQVRPLLAEHLRRTLRTQEAASLEADEALRAGHSHGIYIFATPGGVGLLAQDHTEDRATTEQLERSQALQEALSLMPGIATATLNLRGVFEDVGGSFESLSGFDRASLANVRLTDLLRPSDRRTVLDGLEATISQAAPFAADVTVLRKGGGEQPVKLGMSRMRHGLAPDGVVVVLSSLCA
jgi:prevent-host-death family protein